jgi:hypothetical protein
MTVPQCEGFQPSPRKTLRRLRFVALQRLQRSFDQLAADFFFIFGAHVGIADDMNDAVAEHGTIGADHLGDRQCGGDLHRRYPCFFQFSGDRSTAASAGASRRREDDRVDAEPFSLLGHLAAHAPRVRQRIG